MKKIILIFILIYSGYLYAGDKTYMQFKQEFLNMPIKTTVQFKYKQKELDNNKILLRSFIVSTTAFTGSYVINKYIIPNDEPNKKRLVNITAASITMGFTINYLYKTNKK